MANHERENTGDQSRGGLLIVISGPSGAGKGTVCKALLERDAALALSISATTRQMRPGEQAGREYDFCTEEEFLRLAAADSFLEWAEVHGRYYGTLKSRVRDIMAAGKDCILEIDVQGGLRVRQQMGRSCLTIFLKAPSDEELIRRITGRNREKPEEIKRRMLTAQWEMTQEGEYQYTVVNDDLQEAVTRILEIIREERKEYASAIH